MINYVQLKSVLNSQALIIIVAICFIVLIFAIGFFLGRIMRIKKLEDKWDKALAKTQKTINEILKGEGISKEISLRREIN